MFNNAVQDCQKQTPLCFAVDRLSGSVDFVKILIEMKADVNKKCRDGQSQFPLLSVFDVNFTCVTTSLPSS